MRYFKNFFSNRFRCPVCGKHWFSEAGAYEICPVCGWEDDPIQRREPDLSGGANSMSLNEARAAFMERMREDE